MTDENDGRCPFCKKAAGVYHRKRSDDFRCAKCGREWKVAKGRGGKESIVAVVGTPNA